MHKLAMPHIQIDLDVQEFTNEYLNIFGCPKVFKWITKYIYIGEMAQIQIRIIFEGHFIRIFEYSNICAHHWIPKPKKYFSVRIKQKYIYLIL